ncbi:hypothetical protein ACFL7D_03470 [candidate division KSB1 bacterium]
MKYEIILIAMGLLLLSVYNVTGQNKNNEKDLIGIPFPGMTVEALSGKIIHYPDSLKGEVALIMIAFERQTQEKIDTWLEPFSEKYGSIDDVSFYEIPMLKRRWKLMSGVIDGGMRGGIPQFRHDNVSTYYGNIDKYKKPLLMEDNSDAYVFLLDKNGVIQWYESGPATDERLALLYKKTEELRRKN